MIYSPVIAVLEMKLSVSQAEFGHPLKYHGRILRIPNQTHYLNTKYLDKRSIFISKPIDVAMR